MREPYGPYVKSAKSVIWGEHARAIEVYPADTDVVNTGNYRRLWRLGPHDFAPDLLGME